MTTLFVLIKRNVKLFFKDKGMFFTSLITPAILLVLYATFLGNIFKDSFQGALTGVVIEERLLNGLVGGEILSSILAVSCVTVAFCSNFLMVQDKVNGSVKDLTISPVSSRTLAFAYYFANLISTLIICYSALVLCLVYVAIVGWYITVTDVLLLILDVTLLVLFGNELSSVINFFLTSQGQISAIGTIVSSAYGFICGAYMPISSFSDGLQKVLSFLPGTYGTALIRNHAMQGAFNQLSDVVGNPDLIKGLKDSFDCNLYFFGNQVSAGGMYAIIIVTIAVLLTAYVLLNVFKGKSKKPSSSTAKAKD